MILSIDIDDIFGGEVCRIAVHVADNATFRLSKEKAGYSGCLPALGGLDGGLNVLLAVNHVAEPSARDAHSDKPLVVAFENLGVVPAFPV